MAISIVEFNVNRRAKIKDITGERSGKLVAVEFLRVNHKSRSAVWRCLCDCGTSVEVQAKSLSGTNKTQSCGCSRSDAAKKRPIDWTVNITHGETGRNRQPEYVTWSSMIQRCTNKNHVQFHTYGGAGVSVCERWRASYEDFLRDMGRKPSPKHSIDRINPLLGYTPENCRWASIKEQQNNRTNNRRVIYNSEEMTCSELAEKLGVPSRTMFNWVNASPTQDVTTTVQQMSAKRLSRASPRR